MPSSGWEPYWIFKFENFWNLIVKINSEAYIIQFRSIKFLTGFIKVLNGDEHFLQ
jgi:hypothetical protein